MEWRTFAAVATLRSFSAAARQLGRSPQAVTRAVASLESRVGSRLLNRTTRSVSLTADGERYLERSRGVLAELDALESPTTDTMRGQLSITAPVLFGQLHVLPIVTAFLATHPDVRIKLSLFDRVVSLAEEGVDLAVRIGELPDSALLARRVGDVRTVVVASPAYLSRMGTPRLDTLGKHTCVAFSGTTPVSDRWTFGKRSIAIKSRLVVNTAQAAIDAAVAGLGITRVLSYQVARLVDANKLRIVLAAYEPPTTPIQLVRLPGLQSRVASAFSELALTSLSAATDPRRNVRCTASR